MRLQFAPYMLRFKQPAGTSRGVLTEKITCLLRLFDENEPEKFGIGEAAVFPGLSPEADDRYFYKLMELQANIRLGLKTNLEQFPSLQCGLEQAILDFSRGCNGIWYESPFVHGEYDITINGLIWMGDFDEMSERLEKKLNEGFHCIKLKIGAIDWRKEVELVQYIRDRYSPEKVEIRVDANGGFTMDNAIPRMQRLADLGVHSIEQPIRQGQPGFMKFLCEVSPLPVALDEELLGKFTTEQKIEMLDSINPAYIVLKPSLIGGFSKATEWIQLAEERGIGWWITSSLESNIGLNALAQWVATLKTTMPQGLGTGALYLNNFQTPLYLDGEHLKFNPLTTLDRRQLVELDWRE
ncbi:MAG: o-succinylbenzoate synthase [Muribaculaceae bacterium]|nr:o-succinylbenzoate synthase [Muribaculaceae bacterium]